MVDGGPCPVARRGSLLLAQVSRTARRATARRRPSRTTRRARGRAGLAPVHSARAPCRPSRAPSGLAHAHAFVQFEIPAKRLNLPKHTVDSARVPTLHVPSFVPIVFWVVVRVVRAEHAGTLNPQPLLKVHYISPPSCPRRNPKVSSIARMAPFPASISARSNIAW